MARPPFLVGIADLRRRPGTQRPVAIVGAVRGVETSAARVPAGAEVELHGVLEAIEGGRFTFSGLVSAPWEGECRRCLEPVRGEVEAEVSEIFEAKPTDDEIYPFDGDEIDLEPMVHDTVLLALPLAPLCREDCPGPAPEAFPTGPDAGRTEIPTETQIDPRWAALSELDLGD